jgi:hypothetical protein
MDLTNILEELRSERNQIDQAIRSLERLAVQSPRKRGRPRKWVTETPALWEPGAGSRNGLVLSEGALPAGSRQI